jgi:hypothetical protein
VSRRWGRRCKQILDDVTKNERIVETEGGTTRSYSVENSCWKRVWTCCETGYRWNECTKKTSVGDLDYWLHGWEFVSTVTNMWLRVTTTPILMVGDQTKEKNNTNVEE